MARPRALSGEREKQALALLASGTSAREVARKLGVDHKTVTRLGREVSKGERPSAQGSAAEELDEFEVRQLEVLRRIEEKFDDPRLGAVGLAALVKAQNDTIKAIRLHRLAKPSMNDEDTEAAAERVMARLERLSSRSAPVAPVSEPVEDGSEGNGTEG